MDLFRALAELPPSHPRSIEFQAAGAPAFCIEVSLAFFRREAASCYDPSAPAVVEGMEGIRRLRAAGIPVMLRIDPLFPRSPVANGQSLFSFGLTEAQTLEDLEQLIHFGREVGVRHVVYSPLKIVQPRGRTLCSVMRRWRQVFEQMAALSRLLFRDGSWRLPPKLSEDAFIHPFLALCATYRLPAKFCMRNLIDTL